MGLNNGLHIVPERIESGQSSLAPPPFNNINNSTKVQRMKNPRMKNTRKIFRLLLAYHNMKEYLTNLQNVLQC